uniref:Retrovirus-related Pol polyprotein from transposon TNT 1-94 n=1 Tax=Cajanus cajan TaxID=3821 RepID=A0A151T6B2_CAJCA|nr:hypothetical protein KK1_017139 [Cajanus cajan]
MPTTLGNSHWIFDYACCNHITTNITFLPFTILVSSLPSTTAVSSLLPIHTTNATKINITHTTHVSTSNLNLPNMYYISNFTFNPIFVAHLCEKGLNVLFSPFGVQVQNPQTKQSHGRGFKVCQLFEHQSLHLSQQCAYATIIPSTIYQ